MTLEKAVVDLRNVFAPGMALVAISRVQREEDLYLQCQDRQVFQMSQEVLDFNQKCEDYDYQQFKQGKYHTWKQMLDKILS